jgi:hypothetical protein
MSPSDAAKRSQPITAELPVDREIPTGASAAEPATGARAPVAEPARAQAAPRATGGSDEREAKRAITDVVPKPGNRRVIAIAAGAAILLIVGVVFALGRSKATKPAAKSAAVATKTEAPHKPAEAAKPTDPTRPVPPPPAAQGSAVAHAASDTAETPPAETPPPPVETPPAETPPTDKPETPEKPANEEKRRGPFGGKKVVVEYDTQANENRPVPDASKDDQKAIAKARAEYASGNQRLFGGDANGAIRSYKRALAAYPAYVAGYRGLGLAYAQKGDNAKALQALHTYLGSAPGAKDAPIIRKRITMLEHH